MYLAGKPSAGLAPFYFLLGLQVPPVNLDGYAAAVLVRRYLKNKYSIIKSTGIFPCAFLAGKILGSGE